MRIDKEELMDVRAWAERTSGEVVDSARRLHLARVLEALADLEHIEAAEDGVLQPEEEPPARLAWVEPEPSVPAVPEKLSWWERMRGKRG